MLKLLIVPLFLFFQIQFASLVYASDCPKEKAFTRILKQIHLKFDRAALSHCKVNPENNQQTIIAYAFQSKIKDDMQDDYTLIFLIVNHQNHQVFDSYRVQKKLRSDASELESILLDTAPYMVQSNTRALGLRMNYTLRSSANPYSAQVLHLYDLKNKVQLLDHLIVKEYRAETDTRCNAEVHMRKSTLHMLKSNTNQFYDIQVKSIKEQYEMHGNAEKCFEINRKKSYQDSVLKFNTQQYVVPKQFKFE